MRKIVYLALISLLLCLNISSVSATNFTSTWNTTLVSTGSSNATEVKLPLESSGTYNFTVWWGDGNDDHITAWDQANATHNYSSSGEYNITINGTITGFRFNNGGDKLKLIDISQWGDLNVGNSNGYFYGCSNLDVSATDTLDLTGTTSFYRAFYGCSGLTSLDTSGWNTSSVTSFYYAFFGCSGLTSLDTSGWDTSSVTSFYCGFRGCSGLISLDTSGWDTSSVTSFYKAFYGCSGLTSLNTSGWNVSLLTDATGMFYGVTLNTTSYDSLLNNWAPQSLQTTVPFHGGGSKYSLVGEYSRNHTLIGTYNWTITDGGLNIENTVTSLHRNSTENYFHRVESDGTLSVNRSVITGDATNWIANSTNLTYWQFTTDINPAGSTSFTLSGDNLDNFTVAGMSASTSYDVKNATTVGTFTTDSAGNATFEIDLIPDDYTISQSATGAPSITSYYPTVTIWPEVSDTQKFNVTTDQTTNCTWYINGSHVQYNSSATEHSYTNTSLKGGYWNFTAVVNNTNGTDSQTWLFEVGADSIDTIILSEDNTNLSCLIRWNVTRIGSNVTHWNVSYSNTTAGCTYYFNFDNGTEILNQTASTDDEELWFNSSTLLPVGIYYINSSCPYNYIYTGANEYVCFNNWTSDRTFSQIADNESNDVCYSYYNSTSGLWEAYRVGYSYNAGNTIPKNCSVFGFFDAATTITATPHSGGTTVPNACWFYGYLPGSTSMTLTDTKTSMDADGLNVWSLYTFNNSSQSYTSTGSYSVSPNEGLIIYANNTGEWTP